MEKGYFKLAGVLASALLFAAPETCYEPEKSQQNSQIQQSLGTKQANEYTAIKLMDFLNPGTYYFYAEKSRSPPFKGETALLREEHGILKNKDYMLLLEDVNVCYVFDEFKISDEKITISKEKKKESGLCRKLGEAELKAENSDFYWLKFCTSSKVFVGN